MYSWIKISMVGLSSLLLGFMPVNEPALESATLSPIKNTYPKNYFRSPLDIPLYLSGSFGELRPNHFHSGLDIKTNAKEGYPIYAIADGYISRIRVQASGFGYALYLTHPNGYVSVYAHIKTYSPLIAREAKKKQYEKESFEIDEQYNLFNGIKVKKGDIIALSGNSGSSGGPHLHFEIRDEKTETTINPILFGIPVEDNIKPVFSGLYIYPVRGGMVNNSTARLKVPLIGQNGSYKANTAIRVQGKIGFAIEAYDKHNGSKNSNGLYSTELLLDGKAIYYADLEKFPFSETKFINSYLDYSEKMKSGKSIQKTFVDDGSTLSIYKNVVNHGFVFFNDTNTHTLAYIVTDAHGNTSTLNFSVKAEKAVSAPTKTPYTPGKTFAFQKDNKFTNSSVEVKIPAYSLYDTLSFEYGVSPRLAGTYSNLYAIHNKYTPLNNPIQLSIKADESILPYKDKAIIVNEKKRAQGGVWKEGWVSTSIKTFGNYCIAIDTVPPSIKPITIADGKNMAMNSAILIRIGDNLSGVKTYKASIDGKWALMAFDGKSGLLSHYFDELTGPGKHDFELILTDYKDNVKVYNATFFR